ncbi:Aste57867_18723 [Aphanomyces stellatus]|uniref:Aste57867_18723 protein n=1 Tax=Aphanomyces stellatus TaxID=120398 RepID=A0A485LB71_9STRA|nr:hypothetical protein As57867_018659 [Aphanomyces stellatus]VFT95457.1 Aste57867_18723 [Aphanomyces stellatus]
MHAADRRRHRSKVNQRRYRLKQKAANTQLQDDVASLRDEVRRLEAFLATMPSPYDYVQAIRDYLALFAHGYCRTVPQVQAQQDACLRSLMAPHVECMGQVGIDALVHQWDLYGQLFDALHVYVHDVAPVSPRDAVVVVEATMDLHVVVTATTIRALFPHLLEHKAVALPTKMIGHAMTLPLHCTFEFEATQVARLIVDANVAVALVELTGSAADAAVALDGARIARNARLSD